MRIAITSDSHWHTHWPIPACDVFIHCGDMTGHGDLPETAALALRLREQPAIGRILLVPGNHDRCFEQTEALARGLFDERVTVLIDAGAEIDGITFWGSPWTPPFMQWSFMASESRLASIYAQMPQTLDILITHGPPLGILDPDWRGQHAGSRSMREAVRSRSIRHHVFGHLHGAGGQTVEVGGTAFHNVAACNDDYVLTVPPLLLNL